MANANFSPSTAWQEFIDPNEPKLFESFNFKFLEDAEFREDSVREEPIVPLLTADDDRQGSRRQNVHKQERKLSPVHRR